MFLCCCCFVFFGLVLFSFVFAFLLQTHNDDCGVLCRYLNVYKKYADLLNNKADQEVSAFLREPHTIQAFKQVGVSEIHTMCVWCAENSGVNFSVAVHMNGSSRIVLM